jgi:CheY-like chemotaxis protein
MARVLVVDDEPAAVELLREFFVGKGYDVTTASSGQEALQRVKENRPHLMLLDICMPGMDGLTVLQKTRQIDQEVGVIMVTAINEEETGRQALSLGAFDYVVKPVDLAYLDRSVWHKVNTMLL